LHHEYRKANCPLRKAIMAADRQESIVQRANHVPHDTYVALFTLSHCAINRDTVCVFKFLGAA
jgi:hypothetical protein